MNVTDQWMLERMQQMAANMAASLPQTSQNTDASQPEKGESFQDLMNKAKDQQVEAPRKDSTAQKTENVQDKAPAQKTEGEVITDMRDPRIQALDRETQAQIAAGFLTPLGVYDGVLLLRVDAQPTAIITPTLPNGQPDLTQLIVLVNANGERFEVYLDQENGDLKLFQVLAIGERKHLELVPEQPKTEFLNTVKWLDMTVNHTGEGLEETGLV